MKSTFLLVIVILSFITAPLTGCHKVNSSQQTVQFGLHMHTYIDTNVINPSVPSPGNVYQQEYPDHMGRYEYLTMANIYITNVKLHSHSTNSWYSIAGAIILKRIENEEYVLGNVPADTYDNLQFTIGLGPSLDMNPPSYYSSVSGFDTILSVRESAMYSGTSAGGWYFMSLAGYVDTSRNQSNIHPIPFSYQIGSPGDTLVISPPAPSGGSSFTLLPQVTGTQFVHIIFDYGRLLQSFPITAPVNINSISSPANIWMPVLDSIPGMIRYECSVPNGDC